LALYAFNAELGLIRESVREVMLGRVRLQWWHDRLAELPHRPAAHPVLQALARYRPPAGWDIPSLQRCASARQADMELAPFATFVDLFDYAEATASGLIGQAASVLGGALPPGHRQSGVVVTLAGLLSGLPKLVDLGRVPLPTDGLAQLGIDPASLHQTCPWEALVPLVADLGHAADRNGQELPRVPRRLWPAYAPVRVARWRLARLLRAGYRVDRLPPEAPLALWGQLAGGRMLNRL
jgi:phytoene/squalene synthetase